MTLRWRAITSRCQRSARTFISDGKISSGKPSGAREPVGKACIWPVFSAETRSSTALRSAYRSRSHYFTCVLGALVLAAAAKASAGGGCVSDCNKRFRKTRRENGRVCENSIDVCRRGRVFGTGVCKHCLYHFQKESDICVALYTQKNHLPTLSFNMKHSTSLKHAVCADKTS